MKTEHQKPSIEFEVEYIVNIHGLPKIRIINTNCNKIDRELFEE